MLTGRCPQGPIASEIVAFSDKTISLNFAVVLSHTGAVESAELLDDTTTTESSRRLVEWAKSCLQNTKFESPRYAPYRTKATLNFVGGRAPRENAQPNSR
jgi:hypothetical protein